jgi:hypothetical protein
MADAQVGHNFAFGQEAIGDEIADFLGLDWTAQVQSLIFDPLSHIRHHQISHLASRSAVYDQTERALTVMLADEDHRAMKEGTGQLALIKEQAPFKRITRPHEIPAVLWARLARFAILFQILRMTKISKLFLAFVLIVVGLLVGCQTKSGSREYIPGQGWVPN